MNCSSTGETCNNTLTVVHLALRVKCCKCKRRALYMRFPCTLPLVPFLLTLFTSVFENQQWQLVVFSVYLFTTRRECGCFLLTQKSVTHAWHMCEVNVYNRWCHNSLPHTWVMHESRIFVWAKNNHIFSCSGCNLTSTSTKHDWSNWPMTNCRMLSPSPLSNKTWWAILTGNSAVHNY